MSKAVTRLYKQFRPDDYELALSLNKQALTFSGRVHVMGKKTGQPTKRITLHQKDLKVTQAVLHKKEKGERINIPVSRIMHQRSYDEVRIHTDALLYPGEYEMELTFEGKITAPMNGVYPCNFEHEGVKKQLLATQFESHHAREVFPCIDEPEAKATFTLTLEADAGETILSNTPAASHTEGGDRSTTVFEKTPKMSTYLLAFVAGEMKYAEARTNRGVTVRAYATPEHVERTQFALDVAVKCLDFYDNYFGIPYPLEKCDLIALPDFASGAMENWGCITFREQTLLVDDAHTTLGTKQYVAMVVAHELAHQWFGNLVTMQWWTDLWLNEGFASWIEYLAVDALFPEWDMWTQFIASEQQQAMRLDVLEHTHPIEVPVKHPDEIRTIFDAISYSKGASVIHMLHEYIGANAFRAGLQHYLTIHSYQNTTTQDLWAALETASEKPVARFMNEWTSREGFPVVMADVSEKSVALSQQRFMTATNKSTGTSPWPVPLLSSDLAPAELMESLSQTYTYKSNEPLLINQGKSGFYRTLYNEGHLALLAHRMKTGHIPAVDRIGLIADTLESSKFGYYPTADALELVRNTHSEDNFAVWESLSGWLGSLKLVMGDDELRNALKPFIRELAEMQLERLGWDKQEADSHFDRLLRPIVISMAANADEAWVVERCQKLFRDIHDIDDVRTDLKTVATTKQLKRGLVDPDLRGAVFGTAARLGDKQTFDQLVELHNSSELSEEQVTIAAALTGFSQPELYQKSLEMIQSEHVRLQDVSYWIAYSFMNRHAKHTTWAWLKDNWKWLEVNLGTDLSFYRMPLYAARAFSDDKFKKEYSAFFEPRMSPGLQRSYEQGKEMLDWQSAWRSRAYDEVITYLTSKYHQ